MYYLACNNHQKLFWNLVQLTQYKVFLVHLISLVINFNLLFLNSIIILKSIVLKKETHKQINLYLIIITFLSNLKLMDISYSSILPKNAIKKLLTN